MFRDLFPLLADHFHLIAPDLPGFGLSEIKPRDVLTYNFENLARTVGRFTEVVGLDRYALYVFDYGAPTGFRLAMAHPERVTAIISQNGNAYEEGLSDGWNPIQRYWRDPGDTNRQALRSLLTPESIRWQYEHGVSDLSLVSPDGSTLDAWYIQRPSVDEIQLDLFRDYASNVALYPAFQSYFRSHQPPFWRYGGKMIRSSCPRVRKPIGAIFRTPTSASSTQAISHPKPMPETLPTWSEHFLKDNAAPDIMASEFRASLRPLRRPDQCWYGARSRVI